jgi:hypothetical protein
MKMNATTTLIASALLFAGTANAQLTTNLVDVLPYIEQFSKNLDLEMPLPITTNRVSHFTPWRASPRRPGRNVGMLIDGRFGFTFDVRRHFVYVFSDNKHSLGSLTQKPMTPEAFKAMTVPPSITKEQALAMACKYLVRLGYDKSRFPVGSPQIVQEKPFPVFTIEWPWTLDTPALEKPRPYFTIEIDGLRGKVASFLTLMGSPAESYANETKESPKD